MNKKRMMKCVSTVATAAIVAGAMTTTVLAEGKTLKLAYLVDTLDESQHFVSENMDLYCQYLSEQNEDYDIEYNVFDAKMSLTEQMAQIENCVTMGYDGVVINPIDPDGILPTVESAQEAGLVMLDLRSSNDAYDLQLDYADETSRGEQMKKWFLDYMDEHPDEVFYVGLLQGDPKTPQTMPRCSVLATIAEERPDNFVVLDEQYCTDWTTDSAMKIVEDWLQAYPQMNCIFSAAEQLAYGSAQVLQQAGVQDDFVQVTVNGEAMGIEMVRKDQVIMDCGTFTPATAAGAIRLLVDGITEGTRGRYDYSEYTLFLMTKENVDEVENRYNTFSWDEMGEPKKLY
ncbi:MAG: sugar ABC transporter substrate-binding protein [Eubacteriales bacterium]|nr:sugar ABC transporter substrate-binding protein [Eubacteriales bacterium]